ncbi:kinase-like domain-containing protein [Chiua virens]|nr:kinase-like domain-containing protein [Chiua virens]
MPIMPAVLPAISSMSHHSFKDFLCCIGGEEEEQFPWILPQALDTLSKGPTVPPFTINDAQDFSSMYCHSDFEEKPFPSLFRTSCSWVNMYIPEMGTVPKPTLAVDVKPRSIPMLNSAQRCQWGHSDNLMPIIRCQWSTGPFLMGHLRECHWVGESATLWRRLSVLCDCASVLNAWHDQNIVYGTLTPATVSVAHGRGTLENPIQACSVDSDVDGARWAATELFKVDADPLPTKMSDVYSFGCLMLQMLTGTPPYCTTKRPEQVVYLKHLGKEPIDGQALKVADRHIAFLRWCWSLEPEKRPTMEAIVGFLREEIKQLGEQRD